MTRNAVVVMKDQLLDLQHAATGKLEAAAKTTDKYVHRYPWQAIGVAAGVVAVASLLIGLLLDRD